MQPIAERVAASMRGFAGLIGGLVETQGSCGVHQILPIEGQPQRLHERRQHQVQHRHRSGLLAQQPVIKYRPSVRASLKLT